MCLRLHRANSARQKADKEAKTYQNPLEQKKNAKKKEKEKKNAKKKGEGKK